MFSAILIEKNDAGQSATLTQLDEAQLPEGDVTIDVEYSTLNYKDGLAITAKGPVVRKWPMVPGIDLAGTVSASDSAEFKVGDKVVLNGFGVGETHWGGLAQKAKLKSDWLIPLPKAFRPKQAMAIGTAGYTAALCVDALVKNGVTPEKGEILVTGATGGVGSVAIALLKKAGFTVVAATAKTSEEDYLKSLGAASIIDRAELAAAGKPFQKERWAGVVDAAGSHTLANAIAQTKYEGTVAACGLAQGADLATSVMPFILRGVTLVGIDSVMKPKPARIAAYELLARDLDPAALEAISTEIGLGAVIETAAKFIDGTVKGRYVVDVNA